MEIFFYMYFIIDIYILSGTIVFILIQSMLFVYSVSTIDFKYRVEMKIA